MSYDDETEEVKDTGDTGAEGGDNDNAETPPALPGKDDDTPLGDNRPALGGADAADGLVGLRQAPSLPRRCRQRSAARRTFPLAVRGRSAAKSTMRGYL
jgi:hypothetical protein